MYYYSANQEKVNLEGELLSGERDKTVNELHFSSLWVKKDLWK